MKKIFFVLLFCLPFFLFFTLGCGESETEMMDVEGAGASFPNDVYQAWTYLYAEKTGNNVNYQPIGSSGGIRQIAERNVHFGGTDAPLTPEEQSEMNLLQFPAIMGGIVAVINIDGIDSEQLRFTGEVLADVFSGRITSWNDPAITGLNPNLSLPAADIVVAHRSDGSGTTKNLTLYLSEVSSDWANRIGSGKTVEWPVGLGGKGNEGVAGLVKNTPNSIGYVEYSYAINAKIPYSLLQNRNGNFVSPTVDAFRAAAAHAQWDKSQGYYMSLINGIGDETWPITTPSFIMLPAEAAETNKAVVEFFMWAFDQGQDAALSVGFVPLPMNVVEDIKTYLAENGV